MIVMNRCKKYFQNPFITYRDVKVKSSFQKKALIQFINKL